MGKIISEKELLCILKKSKNVLMIEPPYRRSYIPLGLAKIATYIKEHGGSVTYSRGPMYGTFDLICVASMFTNDAKIVIDTVKSCKDDLFIKDIPIIIGGILASIMPEYMLNKTGCNIFAGISYELDNYLPDYSIDYKIDGYFNDVMTLFTTRGCINKCAYCMVWRMEKKYHICKEWRKTIEAIDRKVCMVSDNSFLSSPSEHVKSVITCLNENNKKIIFNNGMNCREITKQNAKQLASLKYTRNGFRIGFDRKKDDGYYQAAMSKMQDAGLNLQGNSYTYVLYNFDDKPQNAYYRCREAWKFKSNPYLMRYRPLDQTSKKLDFVGKHWTMNLVRAFSNYGQNYGYNRGDKTFEGWMKSSNIELTKTDWEKWYAK